MRRCCFLFSAVARGFTALALIFSILLLLAACGREPISPQSLMQEFCRSLGISRTVFSPSVPEGERGYTGEAFLDTLFGNISGCVSDYAVVFTSDLTHIGECALLLCYSGYDAITVTEAAQRRLDMLKVTHGSLDASSLDTAFILRRERYVLLCALEDNPRAKSLWERLL